MMKVGICLIIKDQNEDLPEWLSHYRLLGADRFFIFDNLSKEPVVCSDNDVEIIRWTDEHTGSQNRAYEYCCHIAQIFDYIGFFDTDEFYMSSSMNIKHDINNLITKFGEFDGLGVYWRMYGSKPPKQHSEPVNTFHQYQLNSHIKSFLNPRSVYCFVNPHFAELTPDAKQYIDENGKEIKEAIGNHTSNTMYIKHLFARSMDDWHKKMQRGRADIRTHSRTMTEFYENIESLEYTDFESPKKVFVQIGANGGQDDFKSMVDKHIPSEIDKLVLIEPLAEYKETLAAQYTDYAPIILHKAIVTDSGINEVKFYTHEYAWLSSLTYNHIAKHEVEGDIREISVPASTLNKIFEDYGIRKIDVLWIDAEGFDDQIIYSIDFSRYLIKEIYFEYVHIDAEKLEQFLENNGYVIEDAPTIDNLTKKAVKL